MSRLKVTSGDAFEVRYGYSRLVRAGDQIFVSGTTARPPDVHGDTYQQMQGALAIIRGALGEAGATMDDVVRTVIYMTQAADLDAVARAHREAFGTARPAATVVEVLALTPREACVEIEVTAIVTRETIR
jgi:enamine deaminase RidA (YjgF/YER057c/UK114 family)